MTKKKRNHPDVEEVLARPWCYYCERDFDDLKILINHQKAKHFKCDKCGRRLNTAGGLSVHMSQVHKETLTSVENALPNRAGLDIEIFGMEGIPEDIAQQHNQRVLTNYHQAEAERRAASGNAVPGSQGNNPTKKPKFESPAELKKRLAEHKAAKLAAEQSGEGSGASTPTATPAATQSTTTQPTNGTWQQQAASPSYPTFQQPGYVAPPATASYGQPPATAAYQAPSYGQPPVPYGQTPTPPQPAYGQPPHPYQQPYTQPPQPGYQHPTFPPPNTFSPPPYQPHPPFPGPQYHPQVPQNGMSSYAGHQVGAPRAYGAGSPQPPFQPNQQTPGLRTHSPGHNGLPQRTGSGSLPSAPGLPQRPAVGAPPVNALQFQQMHQGQIPASHNHALPPQHQYNPQQNGYAPPAAHSTVPPPAVSQEVPGASSLDDLISSASKQADANAVTSAAPTPKPDIPTATVSTPAKEEATEEKSGKKEKDKTKPTRLVYSDNEISPEEKMAAMSKYAFTPSQKSIQV